MPSVVFLLKNLLIVSVAVNIYFALNNMNGDKEMGSSFSLSTPRSCSNKDEKDETMDASKTNLLLSSTTSYSRGDAEDLDGGNVDDGVVIDLDQ